MSHNTAAIVVASRHHGNTLKIADVMAHTLGADVFDAENIEPRWLAGYELIGLGTGIYFGRPHESVRRLVHEMPEGACDVFLFSTAGLPFLCPLWHSGMRRTLSKKGYAIVGEFSCPGWDTVGPLRLIGGLNRGRPDDKDLERAAAFARSLPRDCPLHDMQVASLQPTA